MKKIQQYCKVTDRIEHDPACKEEVIAMAKRNEIRTGGKRRGFAVGTAVAAALLAVNGGVGYLLYTGSRAQENSMVATGEISEMSDIAEQQACAAQPGYAAMMQRYYTAKSGTPCDFDFTGWGTECNYVYEDEDWRVTLTGITGCDWILYYFYDVEPLSGQTWEEFQQVFPTVGMRVVREDGFHYEGTNETSTMPDQAHETDHGVWHCFGKAGNTTGRPFSEDGVTLEFTVHMSGSADPAQELGGMASIKTDFLRPFGQLTHTDIPCPYGGDEYASAVPEELDLWSLTPFGVFYTCEPFASGLTQGSHVTHFGLDQPGISHAFEDAKVALEDKNGKTLDTYAISEDSYYGVLAEGDTAVAVTFLMFDHPWDPEKGELAIYSEAFDSDGTVSREDSRGDAEEKVQIRMDEPEKDDDGEIYWTETEDSSEMTFSYEIDMSKADRKQIIDITADEGGVPIRFTAEVKNFSAEILGTVESGQEVKTEQVNSYSIGLEPQDTPVKLVLHLQPYWSGAESFTLNTNFTVHDGSEADAPVQEMRSSVSVHNKERLSGTYTFGLGLYDDPECKETLEQFTCGEGDTVLYLNTQTTGHDTAKGETYSIYVKVKQDGEEIPFSLTPDGEKKTMQLIEDLPQGDLSATVTPVYAALNAKDSDSKVRVEVYYVPDVIPADHKRETAEEGFEYVHFQKAEATLLKEN